MASGIISSTSLSTPRAKRKFSNNEHPDSTESSSAQNHCKKKQRPNNGMPHAETRILSEPTLSGYNVEYMAAMCYSAYATRRHKAELRPLSEKDSRTFKGKLIAVFKELNSGKIVHHVSQALETIPVLARISPAQCSTRKQLTENFIDLYHSIKVNLNMLDMLVMDLRVNETLHDCLYKTVLGIHYDLNKAVVWHDILPYTDLSLIGLRELRDRIIGRNEYRPLTVALSSIDDIEHWLRLPPPCFEVPAHLSRIAMESMQEVAEEKLRSLYEPSPKIPSIAQLLERIKKEDDEKMRALEIARIQREKESAHRAMEAQAEANRQQERLDVARRELEKREGKPKLAAQVKLREAEMATAKAAAEKKIQQEREAEIKIAVEKKLLEEKEAEAKAAAKKRLQELREAAEATRRATGVEQRKFQDALTAKENEREQLRMKGEENKKSAREILAYLERGKIPQNVLEMFRWPSTRESLAKLTNLWMSNQRELRKADPHQMLADQDLRLQLEYSVMTEALSALVILKARSCDSSEVSASGWDSDVLSQLQSLLISYSDSSPSQA